MRLTCSLKVVVSRCHNCIATAVATATGQWRRRRRPMSAAASVRGRPSSSGRNCAAMSASGCGSTGRPTRSPGVRAGIFPAIGADSRMTSNMLVEIDRLLRTGQYIGGGVRIMPERWSVGIFVTVPARILVRSGGERVGHCIGGQCRHPVRD